MDIAKIEAAFEHYKTGADPADAARYDFFCGLLKAQQARAVELDDVYSFEPLPPEENEELYWSPEPVLYRKPVAIDAAQFAATLTSIADYFVRCAGLDVAVADALSSYDWVAFAQRADLTQAGGEPAQFIDALLKDVDALNIPADLPVSVFMLIPLFALRPHLQGAAEKIMKTVDTDTGRRTHDNPLHCPICGSKAAASFVGSLAGTDGKGRMQYCTTCGTLWPFERIRCGVCGTFAAESLHYFHVEGDAGHRLQNCSECGQYQRVAFQDDLSCAPVMEVEDVVMAKLDKIALDPRFRKEQ